MGCFVPLRTESATALILSIALVYDLQKANIFSLSCEEASMQMRSSDTPTASERTYPANVSQSSDVQWVATSDLNSRTFMNVLSNLNAPTAHDFVSSDAERTKQQLSEVYNKRDLSCSTRLSSSGRQAQKPKNAQ